LIANDGKGSMTDRQDKGHRKEMAKLVQWEKDEELDEMKKNFHFALWGK